MEEAVEKAVSPKAQVKLLWGSATLYHVEDVLGLYKRYFRRFENESTIANNVKTFRPKY